MVCLGATVPAAHAQSLSFTPTWTQQSPSSSPPARQYASMAYDEATGQVVLFGGVGNSGYLSDTWTWNGTTWVQQNTSSSSPSAREEASMAYDEATGQVVLFGGIDSSGSLLNDTWTWNGTTWTQQNPSSTSPSARNKASMVYDAATGQVVLFGGEDGSGYRNDTWTWNGTTWVLQNPSSSSPSARLWASMAYDAATGQVVLFGGYLYGEELNDTWTWNGTTWVLQNPSKSPTGRDSASMAYDAVTGQVVLFGGVGIPSYLNDTWTWNGTTWTQQNLSSSPSERYAASMAYDAATGQVVLFGGVGITSNLNDTWTLQLGAVNMGTANVCPSGASMPAPCSQTATVNFTVGSSAVTVSKVNVLTQGAPNLDFTATATTCSGNLSANSTCTVTVQFAPTHPGPRYGGITLTSASAVTAANPNGTIGSVLLSGTGNGPQVVFNAPLTSTLLNDGFNQPHGVAADSNGNVYVADTFNKQVKKLANTCTSASCVTTLGGGFNSPYGVAVDGSGNVYVADPNSNSVKMMANTCTSASCVTVLGGGFTQPLDVAVDGSGNIYVVDDNDSVVREMANTCTSASCVTTLGGGFSKPISVAVDGSGNIYVADPNNNAVTEMANTCTSVSCVTVLGGGFNSPYGVAVDGTGNVYVSDYVNGSVKEMANTCTSASCVTTLRNSVLSPENLALDGNGNIYVVDVEDSVILEVNRTTPPQIAFTTPTADNTPDTTDGTQTVTVQNDGNQPLVFAIPATGTNPTTAPDFTFTTTSSSACPSLTTSTQSTATLAAGATCNVPLTFTPVAAASGALSESLVFTDNALNATSATQTIPLTGNVLSPPTLTLGTYPSTVTLSQKYVTIPVTVANPNSTALNNLTLTLPYLGTNGFHSASVGYTGDNTCSLTNDNSSNAPPNAINITISVAANATCMPIVVVYYVTADGPDAVTFTLSGSGFSNVTATVNVNQVTPVSATNSTLSVSANPAVAGSGVTVTAALKDAGGNPITGATVTFGQMITGGSASATATFSNGGVGTTDSNGMASVTLTDTAAEKLTLSAAISGTGSGNLSTTTAQFVAPAYTVTTLTDDAGSAANCVATGLTGNNNACSLRDALTAVNALTGSVTATINFASSLTSSATAASPAVYSIASNGTLYVSGSALLTIYGPTSGSGNAQVNLLAIDGGGSVQVLNLASSGSTTLNNLILRNGNNKAGGGGGIAVNGGTVMVSNSTLTGNSSSALVAPIGGGIDVNGGTVTVSDSTLSGNSGGYFGGGIYVNSGTVTVNNSTLTGNSAGFGGGISVFSGTVTVRSSTVSGNSASTGSGIYLAGTGKLYNSIVSDSISGSYTDGGGNITSGTGLNLSALGNYGGPTQTLLPLPGSAAICAGTQPRTTTDQRGVLISATRYGQSACYDVGAVQTEYALTGPLMVPSPVTPGISVSPAPTVSLTEDGIPFTAGAATITLTDADNDLSSGASASNSLTTGVATFNGLQFSKPEATDQLTATLSLTPAVSLTLTSNTFQVSQLTPVLTFTPAPASQAYGTAIAAASFDAMASYGGNTVVGTFSYTATSTTTQAVTALTAGTTVLPADTYTLTATFTPTNPTVYKSGLTITAPYTVTQATQTINFATPPLASATYGSQFTVVAKGGGSGIALVYASGGGCSNVGATYTMTSGTTACTVTVSQAGNANYQAANNLVVTVNANLAMPTVMLMSSVSAVLTQNPVTLTATVASPVSTPTRNVTFLDGMTPLGTVPLNAAGVASLTTSSLTVGPHSITAAYSGDTNFAMLTSGAANVLVADFNLSFPAGASQTILPGGTASYSFTLSPQGSATLPSTIALSVTGLPTGATYSFNPGTTIASGSGATNVTLTITVPQQTARLHPPSRLLPVSLAALLLLPFAGRLRQKGRKLSRVLCGTLLLLTGIAACTAMLSGCGSQNGFLSQPQQSYPVTITATSGALTHTTTITLTVE